MISQPNSLLTRYAPVVTIEMREAGDQMASDLMDAQLQNWEDFKSHHSGRNLDLIDQYVKGDVGSVTAIYIAMKRASVEPKTGPDQSEEIRLLHQEIQNLHKHTTELVEQRNQLHKALKRHLEDH